MNLANWKRRYLRAADTFADLPSSAQAALLRGAAVVLICIAVVGSGCISMVMAQDGIRPTTPFEIQEADRIEASEVKADGLQTQIEALRSEGRRVADETATWKTLYSTSIEEARERLNRDEGIGMGAFFVIGVLQSIGLVRKFEAEEVKLKRAKQD